MVFSALAYLVFGLSSDPWVTGVMFGYGAVPLGSLLGGVVARAFGLRAPFVVAGVVIPVATLLCARVLNERNVAEARAAVGSAP